MTRFQMQLHEWWYWNVKRRTHKITPWIARKLPKKLKYWVVIHGAVTVEPDGDASVVTAFQMLEAFNYGK